MYLFQLTSEGDDVSGSPDCKMTSVRADGCGDSRHCKNVRPARERREFRRYVLRTAIIRHRRRLGQLTEVDRPPQSFRLKAESTTH